MKEQDIISQLDSVKSEKCRNCAIQCELIHDLADLLLKKATVEYCGEQLVGEDSQKFDQYIESIVPEDYIETVQSETRKTVAHDLDELDNVIRDTKNEIAEITKTCSGPLNMKAEKNGVTYIVNVCTSTEVNAHGEHRHLPAHIKTL